MSKAALDAFRRTITVNWPAKQEAQARAALLAAARAGNERTLKEQAARAGVTPSFSAYANTPGNSNLESVKLPGPIVYRYQYLEEVIRVTLEALRANSPVASGRYRDHHTLYVNGAATKAVPSHFSPKDDVFISNPLPYVRKLEIGKTRSGRDFVIQVPDRIYERTAAAMHQRYHNVANIGFGFVRITEGAIADWAGTARAKRLAREHRGGNAAYHKDWLTRQPAIFIDLP